MQKCKQYKQAIALEESRHEKLKFALDVILESHFIIAYFLAVTIYLTKIRILTMKKFKDRLNGTDIFVHI